MKNKFNIFFRINNSHSRYAGSVKAKTAKEAFKLAVIEYFNFNKYDEYKSFYVRDSNIKNVSSGTDYSYGYDVYGQQSINYGFRTNLKQSILQIKEDNRRLI